MCILLQTISAFLQSPEVDYLFGHSRMRIRSWMHAPVGYNAIISSLINRQKTIRRLSRALISKILIIDSLQPNFPFADSIEFLSDHIYQNQLLLLSATIQSDLSRVPPKTGPLWQSIINTDL